MIYEILLPSGIKPSPDHELIHDNPISAKEMVDELHATHTRAKFSVLRDGLALSPDESDGHVEFFEIASVREDACRFQAPTAAAGAILQTKLRKAPTATQPRFGTRKTLKTDSTSRTAQGQKTRPRSNRGSLFA
jgi:hypothetical protein